MRRPLLSLLIAGALVTTTAASAEAARPWNLGVPTARSVAWDRTEYTWRSWPGHEAGSFGVQGCVKLARSRVTCDAWVSGLLTEGERSWDYRCEWTWSLESRRRPRNQVFTSFDQPTCAYTPMQDSGPPKRSSRKLRVFPADGSLTVG